MRITRLIFENINSLYGKWSIDFTDPAFDGGIFAITGPTGSGKTTILDAITLALYGKTARLGTDRTDAAGRGADSYMAELYFELNKHSYCCRFAHRKGARTRQYGGIFQHTLSEDGNLVAEKHTAGKIETLLGMDLEQFCRTVMLAQGRFDAFLTAGDRKSEILEQITGTRLYSLIGQEVNARSVTVAREVELTRTAAAQYRILAETEEQEIRTRLAAGESSLARLREEQSVLECFRQNFAALRRAQAQLEQNRRQQTLLDSETEEFRADAVRLESGRRAARIEPEYRTWCDLVKQQEADRTGLDRLRTELARLDRDAETLETALRKARAELDRERRNAGELEALLTRVAACDAAAAAGRAHLAEGRELLQKNETSAVTLREELERNESARRALSVTLEQARLYTTEHAEDASLREEQARWKEQLAGLKRLFARERETEAALRKLRTEADETAARLAGLLREGPARQEEFSRLSAAEAAARARLETLTAAHSRAELTAEETELVALLSRSAKVESFADERAGLADGEPCPLCGSPHHPYAVPGAAVPAKRVFETRYREVKEALAALEHAELDCRTAAEALVGFQSRSADARNRTALLEAEHKTRETRYQEAARQAAALTAERTALEHALQEALNAFGLAWDGGAELPEELPMRLAAWEKAARSLADGAAEQSKLEEERRGKLLRRQELRADETALRKRISDDEKALRSLEAERTALFGDRAIDAERTAARTRLQACESALREAEVRKSAWTERRSHCERESARLDQAVAGRTAQLAAAENAFRDGCARENMSMELFLPALLAPEALTRLAERQTALATRTSQLAEERGRLAGEVAALQKLLADAPEESLLETRWQELQNESRARAEEVGRLKSNLVENDRNRADQRELLDKLDTLNAQNSLWTELAELIGGKNGQKFQRIAQSITLGNLLLCANTVLRCMNERYELIRSDDTELGIDVIDHWQGDDIRPCANLSGGERFQVSLALALGLSEMAGDRIRVDSLFLDEGFGTLDPNALELAIRTLANLRRTQGKTIGIISHMHAVAESIPTRIEVIPQGGGRSRLEGPGVRSL